MTDEIKPPLPQTLKMRDLPESARNAAIAAGSNVVDLRPTLEYNTKQRHLAAQYKKPRTPNNDGPSYA